MIQCPAPVGPVQLIGSMAQAAKPAFPRQIRCRVAYKPNLGLYFSGVGGMSGVKMHGSAGEANRAALRVQFDHRLKLKLHGSKVTSDAGLLAFREIVGGRPLTQSAASTSQMGRFETEVLTQEANLSALADLSGRWIDRLHARRPVRGIVLDMDPSVSPTFGEQEGTAFNGHFGCTCYHPLFVFNQFGDLERYALRPGNVHSAEGRRDVLEPVIARYRTTMKRRSF
jgi:hypothetical protein